MNKKQLSTNQQRIGKLIEEHICEVMNLKSNNRQHKIGYYDAFDINTLYEIKAVNINDGRAIIDMKNHNKLLNRNGSYVFVKYALNNSDHKLSVITDIKIMDIQTLKSMKTDSIIVQNGAFYTRTFRGKPKEYVRIAWRYLKGDKNDN